MPSNAYYKPIMPLKFDVNASLQPLPPELVTQEDLNHFASNLHAAIHPSDGSIKEARLLEKKANKCIELAKLICRQHENDVEDVALSLHLDDELINKLSRDLMKPEVPGSEPDVPGSERENRYKIAKKA